MLASVIVPARDAAATLPRTLRALGEQRLEGDFEVIVVDDGSRDETASVVARAGSDRAPVRLIRQERLGPAAARNAGARAARGSALAFCDADVFPRPEWLARGLAALETADLVQGLVLPDPEAQLGPFDRTIWVTAPIGLFEAASLFVSPSAFHAVGGFEEWLRPGRGGKALAEDVWFGWRVRRAGLRTAFTPDAVAHHAVFPRGWAAYVCERARVRFFPAMVGRMPELREAFLYRRWFLNARTARLDLALVGTAAAVRLRSPLPLLGAAPYLRRVWSEAHRGQPPMSGEPGRPAPSAVAAADLLADAVGAAALWFGSVRWGSPVI